MMHSFLLCNINNGTSTNYIPDFLSLDLEGQSKETAMGTEKKTLVCFSVAYHLLLRTTTRDLRTDHPRRNFFLFYKIGTCYYPINEFFNKLHRALTPETT